MIEEFIGGYGNRLFLAAAGVGAALLLLVVILWLMRMRGASSPFIRGGKNRQPRLQVLDAAAIDTRRRLVLVRRDNVEHLVMIGGPTDIVIESGITSREASETALLPVASPAVPALTSETPVALPVSRHPALAPPVSAATADPGPQAVSAPAPAVAPVTPANVPPVQQQPAAPRPEQRLRPTAPPPQATQAPPAPVAVAPPTVDPPLSVAPRPVSSDESDIHKEARSEFERILEAEMASRAPAPTRQPRQPEVRPEPQQRREPVAPPAPAPSVIAARQVAAPPAPAPEAVPDAEVQKEIARIFGEMSVTRDK